MDEFQRILRVSAQLASELQGHVFIGGVAIYLHAVNGKAARAMAEASHDSDLMVSLSDFSVLRDTVEIVSNPRLGKHQIILEGVEFDVYVERRNVLIVPYDEIYAHAPSYGDMRVAALEHLLLLKLEAHVDRAGSAKGDKDARDLVSIALASEGRIRASLLSPYLKDVHVKALLRIGRSRIFEELCGGNAHDAKKLRRSFDSFASRIASCL
jgi:hypothetical protein